MKSDEVTAGLKKLGVADVDIKTNASSYRDYYVYNIQTKQNTFTLTITVTVHNRDMAQKVQDYLITTTPTGSISPQATFSTTKQKQLESQGRDEATKDARAKADQQTKNLGFKLGEVKTVSDSSNDAGIMPMYSQGRLDLESSVATDRLIVQPGQNEINYNVQVTYYIH